MLMSQKSCLLVSILALSGLAGCQSNQQFLEQNQAAAMQTTLSRAKFDLNCPEAQPTLISSKVSQPPGTAKTPTLPTLGMDGPGAVASTVG